MSQIGIALQSYHQAHGLLPPASERTGAGRQFALAALNSNGDHYKQQPSYANWAVMLLSYLDHQSLSDSFDWSLTVMDPKNAAPRSTRLSIMSCSSDPYNTTDNAYHMLSEDGTIDATFARGNYGMNCGTSYIDHAPGKPWKPAPGGAKTTTVRIGDQIVNQIWGNGIGGINKSYSIEDFDNGISNLVGIDELRSGVAPEDARGVWALGDTGSSMTWRHGLIGDAGGPNCPRHRADDTIGTNQAHLALGLEGLVAEGMTCCSYSTIAAQATARSAHPGGVNALMMDGSTRFIKNDIDLSVWHAIHLNDSCVSPPPEARDPSEAVLRTPPIAPVPQVEPDDESPPTITNSIGMRLVQLPAGEFTMGLPDAGVDADDPITGVQDAVPPHKVRLTNDFLFSALEVTQAQYEYVMGDNPSWHSEGGGGEGQVYHQDTSNFPVEQVSWADAVAFCLTLSQLPEEKAVGRSYRLPTEAEWEYACRAGSEGPFLVPHVADDSGFNVFFYGEEGHPLADVGSFPPNAWGVYDMRGNAWEWCQDWFGWDYYLHSPEADPQGPDHGVYRVIRYADWRFTGHACKHTKVQTEPWRTNAYIGFRVVSKIE